MITPHYQDESVSLHHGDCLDVLRADDYGYEWNLGYRSARMFPDCSVDAVITDPPYGIAFMGKDWDQPGAFGSERRNGSPQRTQREGLAMDAGRYDLSPAAMLNFQRWCTAWATECLRILKPGGHLLAFGGSRTWHRLAAAIEDAGFEIRDSIAWLFAQGFPKSMNLPGGLGTALKPAFEPIVVARKPLVGTVAANVLEHGTGALNIDACRIPTGDKLGGGSTTRGQRMKDGWHRPWMDDPDMVAANAERSRASVARSEELGRWPTNVVLDERQAAELDQHSGTSTSRVGKPRGAASGAGWGMTATGAEYADEGGASRFFPVFRYEAKAPTSERPNADGVQHPTVKPLDLMRWLVRLVTPVGAVVLEPFAGSGTTAEACVLEDRQCIAIEREADYLPLIVSRLQKPMQQGLFGLEAGA
ncbi:Modification methylase HindIII [Mycobacteroides abscessus subsp. bolletii]|uniref:DNA-methyltransferase n=3 Tax=Mycobacteroides abscessus TaxID=36809 RepID=UPI00092BCDAD|nr:site-specific DNA-methyltransferase [Mycobacteroides abscessus]SHP62684.1 Modification methylase HindIII [Mycobacteroides abscessus subsp. bolletii]SHR47719.1 Modification methylase HindIII [Mycobacteroides abscessus subsp. bolletii]SHS10475.1 Modification methylase HindIII [Mycobacteroides abscessus subsp. bolletii]SHS25550.1 Modification methylase HindIII [Mycobacteroides abscessus subsp. bolletii]SHY53048.1 Modification methylase HindIII [Mycobacteroides abscessus subsp. bolletii]